MQVIVSETGVCRGYGRDKWKRVSGLTEEERRAVREGTALVVVKNARPAGGNSGTTYRIATWTKRFGYERRVPTGEEIEWIDSAINKVFPL